MVLLTQNLAHLVPCSTPHAVAVTGPLIYRDVPEKSMFKNINIKLMVKLVNILIIEKVFTNPTQKTPSKFN